MLEYFLFIIITTIIIDGVICYITCCSENYFVNKNFKHRISIRLIHAIITNSVMFVSGCYVGGALRILWSTTI